MLAFVGTEVSKSELIKSLERHAAADRFVGGQYWSGRGGCAVGCSIHDFRPGSESRHSLYEPLFGIPQFVARLEDSIFERLPQPHQKEWPLRFARAVREGSDLSGVWDRFALWMLIDANDGVVKLAKSEQARKAIEAVGSLCQRKCDGDGPNSDEWQSAAYAAYAYAGAYAAAEAAAQAAYAYVCAYGGAAYLAGDAIARAVGCVFGQTTAIRQADKLIELIETC